LKGSFHLAGASRSTDLGTLSALSNASACADGVGVVSLRSRLYASAVSTGSISTLLPYVRSARALTVELWVRPSHEAGTNANALQPIFALGEAAAARRGLTAAGCQSGQYALLIGQQGSVLRVDVRAAVYVARRRMWVCLQAEVDSARTGGEIFTSRDDLYHLAVVIRPQEPLAVYVNGKLMPALYLAANPLVDAGQPIDVQYESWSESLHALIAPLMSDGLSVRRNAWDGSVHLFAMHAGALSEAQVVANYDAFVRDSLPLAPPVVVNGTEDTPLAVRISGIDPFDAAFSPDATRPLSVFVATLPTSGTLFLPAPSEPPPRCAALPARVCMKQPEGSRRLAGNSSVRRLGWPWPQGDALWPCFLDPSCLDAGDVGPGCDGPCRHCGYEPYADCPASPSPTNAAFSPARPVTANDLPLLLPEGWVWYMPSANAYTADRDHHRGQAPGPSASSFQYFVQDGEQQSELGSVGIVLAGVNDAPVGISSQVDAYVGVPAAFRLKARDIDSPLDTAYLVSTPMHGTLHRASEGAAASGAVLGPALKVGDVLSSSEWRLIYLHQPADDAERSPKIEKPVTDLLLRDNFRFRVCDANKAGAAACSTADAIVELAVHSALGAVPGETVLFEESPGVVRLQGLDRRGSAFQFVVSEAPREGALYPCVPYPTRPPQPPPSAPPSPARPPTFVAFVGQPSVTHEVSEDCCLEPQCLQQKLGVGQPLASSSSGKAVFVPPVDYYNCATHDCTGGRAAATAFSFFVRDEHGRRSANAVHTIWVRNVNDRPTWTGAHHMSAEALQRTPLPLLGLREPDGDAATWEVQLQAVHGFLSLPQTSLQRLAFTLGDGTSDRLMRMSGVPSAVLAALNGATYRAIDEGQNDTVIVSIADPRGSTLSPIGKLEVQVTSAVTSADDDVGVDVTAAVALWVVIGAVLLLCGVQIFGWLQRCCHPEAAEAAANYRYLREQEAEEDKEDAEAEDSLQDELASPRSFRKAQSCGREVTIRQWALQQNRTRANTETLAAPVTEISDAAAARVASPGAVTPAMLAMVFKGRPHVGGDPGDDVKRVASAPAPAGAAHPPAPVIPPLALPSRPDRDTASATTSAVLPLSMGSSALDTLSAMFGGHFGGAATDRVSPRSPREQTPRGQFGAAASARVATTPRGGSSNRGHFGAAASARASPRSSAEDADATAPTSQGSTRLSPRFSFPYRHRQGGEVMLKSDAGPYRPAEDAGGLRVEARIPTPSSRVATAMQGDVHSASPVRPTSAHPAVVRDEV
jgi:hypothetical protein